MIRDTLLIIDDSELDLAILNEIFKNLFHVECVSDARRGLTFLHHNQDRICAILLDICLERRGAGFTVLHQLQTNPSTAPLPVILITTDANEKDVRASVERGAVDFLVKPVDPHTVQDRVCDVVRSAWPPQSTILDHEPEPQPDIQPEPQPDEGAPQPFPQGLNAGQAQALCQVWNQTLEAFCALRPALNAQAHQQLSAITILLAQCYQKQNPDGGLSQEDAALIGLAAGFCDVGLLAIPDQVAEEGEEQDGPDAQIYYQHTQLGQTFFLQGGSSLPLFRYAAEIALWHHKNADGSGYPLEEGGESVPLSARLTRTALRMQRYLHYYQGCSDRYERMLRTLKGEVGTILFPEMYQLVEQGDDSLRAALLAI